MAVPQGFSSGQQGQEYFLSKGVNGISPLPTSTLMELVASQKLSGLGPFSDGNPCSMFPLEIGKNQSHEIWGWRAQREHRDDREKHWQG